ncbi:MAG: signal recognition particle protein [Alphaproteobacteria bacterium]|nr:signal recognition particle protein [Alphaproteobacteria bacterium]
MFETLSSRLSAAFERLTKRGALTAADVDEALKEVRIALLDADVALPVVKSFLDRVRNQAVGERVLRSVTPGQMVVKIVHDELAATLGGQAAGLRTDGEPPLVYLMVGLQGSGKTTTTAKLGLRLQSQARKKALLASLDVQRPAAQEQLRVLGEQAQVDTLPILAGQMPVDIARRALSVARLKGYDLVLLDTAGRLHVDAGLMAEVAQVRDLAKPAETLLVADALTGQDAVNSAKAFHDRIGLSGIVLTRVDGDGRGGAALSMRAVTGCPIKLIGVGEKLDALEEFDPQRMAGRILGMGDIVALVEKAKATIEEEDAKKLADKVMKGRFDLDDMAQQLAQLRKMGGMDGIMGLLPGVAKAKAQLAQANIDDRMISRQEAIIRSMTRRERRDHRLIDASRRRRIAAGSGTTVADVNRVLKQYLQMSDMMKRASKLGEKGLKRHGLAGILPRPR